MKSSILILAIAGTITLSSCSVYRSGQTPDDVYYSPAREVVSSRNGSGGYVESQSSRNDGRRYYSNSRSYSAYDDFATMDDRWLMMRVRNPYRWSMFDDYAYYNSFSPYAFGGMGMFSPMGFYNPYGPLGWGGFNSGWSFGLGFGSFHPWGGIGGFYSPFNSYWGWNSFYNPYYHSGVVIVSPKVNPVGYSRARNFNLNSYNNSIINTSRPATRPLYNNTNSLRYNNSNNSTINNSNRRQNSNDYYRAPSNSNRPSRTYTPSNNRTYNPSPSYSPSSGGSRGGSTGGGVPGGGGSGSRPSRR